MLNVVLKVNCLLQNKYNGCAGMVDRLRLGRRGVSHISSSLIVHIIYDCLLSTLPKKTINIYVLWCINIVYGYIYIYIPSLLQTLYMFTPPPVALQFIKKK